MMRVVSGVVLAWMTAGSDWFRYRRLYVKVRVERGLL
jgi:hypothetical protein